MRRTRADVVAGLETQESGIQGMADDVLQDPLTVQMLRDPLLAQPGAAVQLEEGEGGPPSSGGGAPISREEFAQLGRLSPRLGALEKRFVEIGGQRDALADDASDEPLRLQQNGVADEVDSILNEVTAMPFFARALSTAKTEAVARINDSTATAAIQEAVTHFAGNREGIEPAAATPQSIQTAIQGACTMIQEAAVDNNALMDLGGRTWGTYEEQSIALSSPAMFIKSVDFSATSAEKVVDMFVQEMADVLIHEAVAHAISDLAIGDSSGRHEVMKLVIMKLQGKALSMKDLPKDVNRLNGTISRLCLSGGQCSY